MKVIHGRINFFKELIFSLSRSTIWEVFCSFVSVARKRAIYLYIEEIRRMEVGIAEVC